MYIYIIFNYTLVTKEQCVCIVIFLSKDPVIIVSKGPLVYSVIILSKDPLVYCVIIVSKDLTLFTQNAENPM